MSQLVHDQRLVLSTMCLALSWVCTGCPLDWQPVNPLPPLPAAGSPHTSPADAGVASYTSDPVLPTIDGDCPAIESGWVTVNDIPVRVWLKEAPAGKSIPLVIYWHGTGSNPNEAETLFAEPLGAIEADGGLIVALGGSTQEGDITSTGTWTTGDFALVDRIVACAVKQLPIDTRRIYTAGCDSGAIHAGVMAYQRSNYIAATALNSGGQVRPFALQNPAHAPAALTAHGAQGDDVVIIDFADASLAYAKRLASDGGFAVDCGHELGHCGAPAELRQAFWQFLKDHPFAVTPEPYANGLPGSFPSYCHIVTK